ncbi:hypothetical protein Phi40:1_gp064 [Cellulophaga phage phi40:1]|jgi:hypothetical protein|uniref:Uncharacterized protein n=1 Tax=Cellulophaga phage phi38:1 TaxID=1327977 RepID=R9ZXW8_9CAUD|nr:hypothetical protein Phi38:1_gp064 [Cellulophaga phage phi38:1]AGO47929.1 hypothetical protein Phi40:1_gp064 [Cellulophaga phage phi40:1]AGO48094.1 hypothetical protein Phi38:1_gp064 [Cellulophaga phage phi38:1]
MARTWESFGEFWSELSKDQRTYLKEYINKKTRQAVEQYKESLE